MSPTDKKAVRQAAKLLVEEVGLPHWPSGYTTMKLANAEVKECVQRGWIARAAFSDDGDLIGWIGARPEYGVVWELQPIAVRRDLQGQGIGRAMVRDLEAQVKRRGGLTLRVGTDDEDFRTSLSRIDLYKKDIPELLKKAHSKKGHPMEFYRKVGFTIVGVMPDANGIGKPDIYMAKRV